MTSWTSQQEREYQRTLKGYHALQKAVGAHRQPPPDSFPAHPTIDYTAGLLNKEVRFLRSSRARYGATSWLEHIAVIARTNFRDHVCAHLHWDTSTSVMPVEIQTDLAREGTYELGSSDVRARFFISPIWKEFPQWRRYSSRLLLKRRRCADNIWHVVTAEVTARKITPWTITTFEEVVAYDQLTNWLYIGPDTTTVQKWMEEARADRVLENL